MSKANTSNNSKARKFVRTCTVVALYTENGRAQVISDKHETFDVEWEDIQGQHLYDCRVPVKDLDDVQVVKLGSIFDFQMAKKTPDSNIYELLSVRKASRTDFSVVTSAGILFTTGSQVLVTHHVSSLAAKQLTWLLFSLMKKKISAEYLLMHLELLLPYMSKDSLQNLKKNNFLQWVLQFSSEKKLHPAKEHILKEFLLDDDMLAKIDALLGQDQTHNEIRSFPRGIKKAGTLEDTAVIELKHQIGLFVSKSQLGDNFIDIPEFFVPLQAVPNHRIMTRTYIFKVNKDDVPYASDAFQASEVTDWSFLDQSAMTKFMSNLFDVDKLFKDLAAREWPVLTQDAIKTKKDVPTPVEIKPAVAPAATAPAKEERPKLNLKPRTVQEKVNAPAPQYEGSNPFGNVKIWEPPKQVQQKEQQKLNELQNRKKLEKIVSKSTTPEVKKPTKQELEKNLNMFDGLQEEME